jgi:hypothetical protein
MLHSPQKKMILTTTENPRETKQKMLRLVFAVAADDLVVPSHHDITQLGALDVLPVSVRNYEIDDLLILAARSESSA